MLYGLVNLPPTSFRKDRRGIRFQLSTLLLLSTLNGIALAAGAIILFRAIFADPTPADASVRATVDKLTDVQSGLLLLAVPGSNALSEACDPSPSLQEVYQRLTALGNISKTALTQLTAYRREVDRWSTYILEKQGMEGWPCRSGRAGKGQDKKKKGSAPVADKTAHKKTDKPGVDINDIETGDALFDAGTGELDEVAGQSLMRLDAEGDRLLTGLNHAYRRLLGEMAILANLVRPDWVDSIVPWVPWVMGYVVAVALLTMVMAFRLQVILSNPLEKLRIAAHSVAGGRLDQEIPAPGGAYEVQELARNVEAMRERLVSSINGLDTRTEELSSILDSLSDGVLMLDEEGKISDCNPRSGEILTGRSGQSNLPKCGLYIVDVIPELHDEELSSQAGTRRELSFPLLSGKQRTVEIRFQPIRGSEHSGGLVVVLRDVSHEHELEQMQRDFLSVVTHELKTPLTSIEGYTRLLLMGKGGALNKRQASFTQTIVDQTLVLKEMIQNLLDITRIEGQNLPIKISPVDPADEARTAIENIRGSAQGRNLNLVLKVEETSVRIRIDPFRLQQILGNLLSNAIKFTPEGGQITVEEWLEGGDVKLSVTDTGRGIPPEAVPHLFDKFYQVAQGDTRLAGGAGLGLYICKELTTAQGGEINVESTLGKGSRFTLTFPITGNEKKTTADGEKKTTADGGKKTTSDGEGKNLRG